MNIGLLSDTHGYLDPKLLDFFEDCDEIWHAGDFGSMDVVSQLENFKPLRGVYGNIDGKPINYNFPEHQNFLIDGIKIWMTHIGGYPPNYSPSIKEKLNEEKPDLFICGHSHILKVMPDKKRKGLLHINPGAAGHHGFHQIRTAIRFCINRDGVSNLEVIELGKRGRLV